MKKFDKQIYVVRMEEGTPDEYLLVAADAEQAITEAGNGGKVAAYTLDKVLTASITHEFKKRA